MNDFANAANPAASQAKPARKSPRRRAREFALQGIYQWQVGKNDAAAIEAQLADEADFDKTDQAFLHGLLRGVFAQHQSLQQELQAHLDRPFHELSPVEASILLVGAFELTNDLPTPYRVIINEAIELTKGFGGTDGHKYVNGVLDKLAAKLRPAEVAAKQAERRAAR